MIIFNFLRLKNVKKYRPKQVIRMSNDNVKKNILITIYREVNGILLYQGFPRPTKHPMRSKGCF